MGGQTPADHVYAVVYLEVMPSARTTGAAALKQYREDSRKEAGYVGLDAFEQIGRPGHLAIIESWSNQKAFDDHQNAIHSKQFLRQIEPVRVSDYDQRLYKDLASDSSRTARPGGAIYVVTHVDMVPQSDGRDLLKQLAEASRKEQGNLQFDVLQQGGRPNHYTLLETWQNENALNAHAAAAHTKKYREALHSISGSPVDERLYKLLQ
jgi:quinol monooxygenase YgiN